jgi:hypothetical protein
MELPLEPDMSIKPPCMEELLVLETLLNLFHVTPCAVQSIVATLPGPLGLLVLSVPLPTAPEPESLPKLIHVEVLFVELPMIPKSARLVPHKTVLDPTPLVLAPVLLMVPLELLSKPTLLTSFKLETEPLVHSLMEPLGMSLVLQLKSLDVLNLALNP